MKSKAVSAFTLLEQLIAFTILALALLAIAALLVRSSAAAAMNQRRYEASCRARDEVEKQLGRSLKELALGSQSLGSGTFSDGQIYTIDLDVQGPVAQADAAGLTPDDLRQLQVKVRWVDGAGPHVVQVESLLNRMPR